MQTRDKKTALDYERKPIEKLAHERYINGCNEGKHPDPWLEEGRDFFQEIYEELADAYNYLSWLIMRSAGKRKLFAAWALRMVKYSYDVVLLAEKEGNGIKKGKIK